MKAVLALAAASLFLMVPMAAADHVQQEEGRSVSFDHKTGNEWWVEVVLGGADASSVSSVHAKDEGGRWVQLEKKDWGAWAASFHIEPGNDVRFRATWGDDRVKSCWFSHPDGAELCDEPEEASDEFDASFRTSGGNEWWVEVYVDANEPLSAVHARADGGSWVALEKKDWGAWAKSFHVEDGSLVQFRATSAGGERDLSGEYRWPEGTKVSESEDPASSSADVAFGPKAGNQWWVETIVVGDEESIEAVQARPQDGSWHDLTYRDWGSWAASFHVPAGADVEFRATTPSGTDTSILFSWPDARPVDSDGSWPEEGSYARYDEFRQAAPGIEEDTSVNRVYHDGEWWYHRVGTYQDPGGSEPVESWGRGGPVMMPPDVQIGDTFQQGNREVTVLEEHEHEVHQDGERVDVRTWYGENHTDWDYAQYDWDQATGIQLYFHDGGTGWMTRELLDTDAPMQKA